MVGEELGDRDHDLSDLCEVCSIFADGGSSTYLVCIFNVGCIWCVFLMLVVSGVYFQC